MDVVDSVRNRLENVTALVTQLAGRQDLVEQDESKMAVLREMDELLSQWCRKLELGLEQGRGMLEKGDPEKSPRVAVLNRAPDVPMGSKQTKRTSNDSATADGSGEDGVRRSSRKKKKKKTTTVEAERGEEVVARSSARASYRKAAAPAPRKVAVPDSEDYSEAVVVAQKGNAGKRVRGEASKIRDGMPGRTEAGGLVYFALSNKVPMAAGKSRKRQSSLWSCPVFGVVGEEEGVVVVNGGAVVVDRTCLDQLQFSSLVQQERQWYLQQLEADLVRRFQVNAPVLFENAGAVMLNARQLLVDGKNGDESNVVIEELRLKKAHQTMVNIVSSSLSAVNNTVLMVAAKIHSQLALAAAGEGFLERAEALAGLCALKADTIARYRSVGELMLRSPVVACMLPGFVAPLLEPITCLLDDDSAVERLEAACMTQDQVLQLLPAPPSVEDHIDDANGGHVQLHVQLRNAPPDLMPLPEMPLSRMRDAPRKCRKCGEQVIQYECSSGGCFIKTCWKCAGYKSDPLEPTHWYPGGHGEWLKVYMFCPKHCLDAPLLTREYGLYTKGTENNGGGGEVMTLQQFLVHSQVSEAATIVELFSRPSSLFTIVPQPGDGWCTFHCVCSAMEMELHDLVGQLKSSVAAYLEDENVRDKFDKKLANKFKKLWEELDPEDAESVQVLWASDSGDYSLPFLAWVLNRENACAVQIHFWEIRNLQLKESSQKYPDTGEEDIEFQRHIHILKSNAVMPHHDLLIPREPDAPSMDRDGFVVHRQAVAVDSFTRDYFESLPLDLFHVIFNNAPANSEENDGKRLQVDFATIEGSSVTAQRFMIELKRRLRELVPNYRVGGAAVLRSEEGCLGQLPHLDYPPPPAEGNARPTVPLGCLVALMDGTTIDVWSGAIGYELNGCGRRFERQTLVLNAGDVLLFRGDLVHAGASSAVLNVRVHCYLEPLDGSFQRQLEADGTEVTYFMHECDAIVWREDV